MMEARFVGLFMLIGIPLLLLLIGTFVLCVLLLRATRHSGGRVQQQEEARMVQEMYRELDRLSARVEALETILLEAQKECRG